MREAPERVRRHVDRVGPDDVRAVLAETQLREQIRRMAKRLIDPERRDEAGYVDEVSPALSRRRRKLKGSMSAATMRGSVFFGMINRAR